ncbi:hypothetical protein [Sulfobacillus thermosulfidooxidans]|uniref:hypothetical protein n=1 Tax=Sulfobacillus thermosulfidooxidans TaxID=28034 RepID=UPI0006B417CC|nr:hypothetical protein [Sulfobacillus thermosulfidooxidans]
MPSRFLARRVVWSLIPLFLAGCGTQTTASHPASSHPAHAVHHTAHQASASRSAASTSPASSITAAFGSVAWSQAVQADLARQLHHPVYPLDIVADQPGWNLPLPSALVLEPHAYHGFLYYAIARPHQAIQWQAVSTNLVNTPISQAQKLPQPIFWPLHFAWQLETNVQYSPLLGGTLPWDNVTGHVENPVAWTATWTAAQPGAPASTTINVYLPVYWKDPQDEGILPTALPDGSLIQIQIFGAPHSHTWSLGPDLYKVTPQNLVTQQFPANAKAGDFFAVSASSS